MRRTVIASLASLIIAVGSVDAQTESTPEKPVAGSDARSAQRTLGFAVLDGPVLPALGVTRQPSAPDRKPASEAAPIGCAAPELQQIFQPCPAPCWRIWASFEFLYWHTNNQPIRVPLVSGNADPVNTIGALNEPGTVVLFGAGSNQSTNLGWFSGGRIGVGAWLDPEQQFGIEVSGFLLENRSKDFTFSSPGGTAPLVSIPITATQAFGLNPAGPTSLNAGGAANSAIVNLSSRLWGAEANGLVNLYSNDRIRIAGLAGFRYLDLNESLTLADIFFDQGGGGTVNVVDSFGTRNQYYGGQIGAKVGFTAGRWSLDTTAKIAFGTNHQVLTTAGGTGVIGGAFGFPNGVTPSGVFAEPSNIGQFSHNVFAVVPEVQAKLGLAISPRIQSFVGYNFLYLNNALRPGNQIDNNVNPTQNAFFVPPGTLVGQPAPLPFLHSSGFWAQGINFGVELKF